MSDVTHGIVRTTCGASAGVARSHDGPSISGSFIISLGGSALASGGGATNCGPAGALSTETVAGQFVAVLAGV